MSTNLLIANTHSSTTLRTGIEQIDTADRFSDSIQAKTNTTTAQPLRQQQVFNPARLTMGNEWGQTLKSRQTLVGLCYVNKIKRREASSGWTQTCTRRQRQPGQNQTKWPRL